MSPRRDPVNSMRSGNRLAAGHLRVQLEEQLAPLRIVPEALVDVDALEYLDVSVVGSTEILRPSEA